MNTMDLFLKLGDFIFVALSSYKYIRQNLLYVHVSPEHKLPLNFREVKANTFNPAP